MASGVFGYFMLTCRTHVANSDFRILSLLSEINLSKNDLMSHPKLNDR